MSDKLAHTTETASRARGNISRWSIEHPYIVTAFYLGVALLAGLVIFFQMPRRMMPYVESPMVGIVSMMPGLSAEEMEIYFSKPIEERMVDLKNVHFVRSTSQEGFSIVTVEFWYGTDMKKALFDVQSLMNVVQADLPMTGANLKPSWVLAIDPLNIPVLSLAVTGEGYDRVGLRTLVENEVVNRLKSVKDVYSVVPFGGDKLQMQVVVDRERLAAYKMSLLDLKNMLDMQNQARPAGALTYQDREIPVRSDFRARTPEEVAAYPIASMDGRTVYLRDVAEVGNAPRERRSLYRFNGKEAVELSIVQQPDASSVQVIKDVKAKLKEIQQDFPGLKFEVAYDNSTFVGFLMDNMVEELLIAVLLTGVVVLFFLGNVRGTLISVITIPISLGMALLAMVPLGMTLNSSTLIGLLLSIGRLVDDSIIDIHSIERHLRMGKSPKEATVDGISEVRLAVLAITFMLCVALLPLAFSGGIVQYMFEGIVWAIILALLASALVSFTLTAVLSANLFKPHSDAAAQHAGWFERTLLGPFQRFLEGMEAHYRGGLGWAIRNRFTVLAGALAVILAGVALYPKIGSEMMPLADVSQAYAQLEATPGTSFARTSEIAAQVEQLLLKQPEVEKVSSEVGFEPGGTYFTGYSMGAVNAASMMITLVDSSKRKRDIWQVIDGVQAEAMRTIPGVRRLAIKEMGADVMASSAAPIQVIFYGPDLEKLAEIGEQAKKLAEGIPGFFQVSTSWSQTLPQLHVSGGPGPRPGAGPHGERRGRSGLLRSEGRPHQRVLSPGQQAAVHDPAALSRRPAAGRGGSGASQDRREEGGGGPLELGGADRGASRTHAHRARQLPPGDLGLGLLPEGGTAQHGAVHGPPHGRLREDQFPPGLWRGDARRHDPDGGVVPAADAGALPGRDLHVLAARGAVPKPHRAVQHDLLPLADDHGDPGWAAPGGADLLHGLHPGGGDSHRDDDDRGRADDRSGLAAPARRDAARRGHPHGRPHPAAADPHDLLHQHRRPDPGGVLPAHGD